MLRIRGGVRLGFDRPHLIERLDEPINRLLAIEMGCIGVSGDEFCALRVELANQCFKPVNHGLVRVAKTSLQQEDLAEKFHGIAIILSHGNRNFIIAADGKQGWEREYSNVWG